MKNKKNYAERMLFLSLCVIIIISIIVCVMMLMEQKSKTKAGEKTARIYQNQKLIREINLDEVKEAYTIEISGEHGEYNVIEVRPGEIGMKSASCPDELCVQMGFIRDGKMPVTCLPNKIVIEIIQKENEETLDGIAY